MSIATPTAGTAAQTPATPSISVPSLTEDDVDTQPAAFDFTSGELWSLYERRKKNNQDLVIIIADHQNRRGTGKTSLTLKLGDRMDTNGGLTTTRCTLDPVEFRDAYTREPKKSGLVMDEAEAGIGNRDSMTNVNKALAELMSMGRVEEKYVILNAPNGNRIDKAVRELCDVLILVEARGRARAYRLVNNPFENRVYHSAMETIRWSSIRDRRLKDIYESLHEEKQAKLDGDTGDSLVRRSEVKKKIRKAVDEHGREIRDELIVTLYNRFDLTYDDVAELLPDEVAVNSNRVGKIYRENAEPAPV